MTVQIIEKGGKPDYAVIPYQDYKKMLEKVEMIDDVQAYDIALERAKDEESFPSELIYRMAIDGENPIKVFREYRKLTQARLAELAGVKAPYISELESGKKEGSVSVLKRIAECLELDLDDIV